MKSPEFFGSAWTIARKDLVTEFRKPQEILSILAFTLGSLLIAGLVLQGTGGQAGSAAAVMWIILFFLVILAFTTAFIREADQGTLGGLKTLPCPPVAILAGKFLSGCVLVFLGVILIVPAVLLFFSTEAAGNLPAFFALSFLGAAGLSLAGAFVSSLVMFSEGKTLLSSLLLIPVCTPMLFLSVKATGSLLGGAGFPEIVPFLRLMIAFILLLIVIILATFSAVIAE